MNRFRITAYYEDQTTSARVAQEAVVIAKDAESAVAAVARELAPRAIGRHIDAVEITERKDIESGVVHVGEPYIPINWPLVNRPRQAQGPAKPAAPPAPQQELRLQPPDDVLVPRPLDNGRVAVRRGETIAASDAG